MNLKRKFDQVHTVIRKANHDFENIRKKIKLTYKSLKLR